MQVLQAPLGKYRFHHLLVVPGISETASLIMRGLGVCSKTPTA